MGVVEQPQSHRDTELIKALIATVTQIKAVRMRKFLLLGLALLVMATLPASAAQPVWAKKATAFRGVCLTDKTEECKPLPIPSPDGKSSVEVRYRKEYVSAWDWILQSHLRVITPGAGAREVALPEEFSANYYTFEVLWSPDSHAFFVNGSNTGEWASMYVYLADDPAKPINVTEAAQRDMLKQFPPCKAASPNADDAGGCKKTSRGQVPGCEADPKSSPDYNMVGIDWANASTILVMAEVPCDSLFGGIMCQVMGYELEVPSGHILKRIDPKKLKLEWQKSMAWNFRIPDPPQYCE